MNLLYIRRPMIERGGHPASVRTRQRSLIGWQTLSTADYGLGIQKQAMRQTMEFPKNKGLN